MAKIYYVIPDLGKRYAGFKRLIMSIIRGRFKEHFSNHVIRKHKPTGGVKVIYQHCLLLREAGFDAEVIRMGKYVGNFFDFDITPLTYELAKQHISSDDIVVIPEIAPSLIEFFPEGKKILFAQNWRALYKQGFDKLNSSCYVEGGFKKVLYCGDYIRSYLTREPQENVIKVQNYIDLKKFTPKPDSRIPNRIMALSRKNPDDLKRILALMDEQELCIDIVDGVSESEIIQRYQSSDIFLATGYPEGFGLPALEAMACGATVVGFSGGGGLEYMKHKENCLIAEDGDVETAASLLKNLLRDQKLKERLRRAGQETSEQYNKSRTKEQLTNFYKALLESGST